MCTGSARADESQAQALGLPQVRAGLLSGLQVLSPASGLAGRRSSRSARSGLWGQGWGSLMYGQSLSRAVLLVVGVQLTGKSGGLGVRPPPAGSAGC